MTGGTPPPGDGEPLVRPFLDRGPGRLSARLPMADELRVDVRPYLITGGRTEASHVDVAMETVVVAVAEDTRTHRSRRPTFERARVLAECDRPRSVAEVAARIGVPLMVALIVVGDLVAEGLLEASTSEQSQADDVTFLERLIDGVTAL